MNNYNEMLAQINPSVSNESLAEAVINKSNARKRATVRKLSISAIVTVFLAGMTITAGAVNNWDYTAIARFFFGGSENVIEGMHDEIRYQVTPSGDRSANENHTGIIENESDFSIEITGLYADNETILIAFDIIADNPVFSQEYGVSIIPDRGTGEILFNNTINEWESVYSISKTIDLEDVNLAKAVYRIKRLDNAIEIGNVYTLMFHGIKLYMGYDALINEIYSYPIGNDTTEIMFIIDTLAMENTKTVYPDIKLENGNIITEMKINPFAILLYFDGIEKTPTLNDFWFETNIISKTPTRSSIEITTVDSDNFVVESVMYNNFIKLINHDGETSELINVIHESIADSNTQKTWIRFEVDFTQTLNINDIAAVIYRGVEIPLG